MSWGKDTYDSFSSSSTSVCITSCQTIQLLEQVSQLLAQIRNAKYMQGYATCTNCKYFARVSHNCQRCKKIIESFLSGRDAPYRHDEDYYLIPWIYKMKELLMEILESKLTCPHITKKHRSYHDELDKLIRKLRAPFKLPKRSVEIQGFLPLKSPDESKHNTSAASTLEGSETGEFKSKYDKLKTKDTRRKPPFLGAADEQEDLENTATSLGKIKKTSSTSKINFSDFKKYDDKLGKYYEKNRDKARENEKYQGKKRDDKLEKSDEKKKGKNGTSEKHVDKEGKEGKKDAHDINKHDDKVRKSDEKKGKTGTSEKHGDKEGKEGKKYAHDINKHDDKVRKSDEKKKGKTGTSEKHGDKVGKEGKKDADDIVKHDELRKSDKSKKGIGGAGEKFVDKIGKEGKKGKESFDDIRKHDGQPGKYDKKKKDKAGSDKKHDDEVGKQVKKVGDIISKPGEDIKSLLEFTKTKQKGKAETGKKHKKKEKVKEKTDKDDIDLPKHSRLVLQDFRLSSETLLLLKHVEKLEEEPPQIKIKPEPKPVRRESSFQIKFTNFRKSLQHSANEKRRSLDDVSTNSSCLVRDAKGNYIGGCKYIIIGNNIELRKREKEHPEIDETSSKKLLQKSQDNVGGSKYSKNKLFGRKQVHSRHTKSSFDSADAEDEESIHLRSRYLKYKLSDRKFIENGYTKLPIVDDYRSMYVYKTFQSHKNWFDIHKNEGLIYYDTGEILASVDQDGYGKWYYKDGETALHFYRPRDHITGYRCIVYSPVITENQRKRYTTIIACFDYMGYGVVYDHSGNLRLKYNQCEGAVYDTDIAPQCRWQWHSLGGFFMKQPVNLEQYEFIPEIPKEKEEEEEEKKVVSQAILSNQKKKKKKRKKSDSDDSLLDSRPIVEFENFLKSAKELKAKFKPYKIRLKIFKINEKFSLHILDQENVYLIFVDGPNKLKMQLGVKLIVSQVDHRVVYDFAELKTPYDYKEAQDSESIANIKKMIEKTRKKTQNKENLRSYDYDDPYIL